MSRRARHPPFLTPDERDQLLQSLSDARGWTIRCNGSARFGSPRYLVCDAVTDAIDRLAEELTGHRDLFHDKGSSSPTLWQRWKEDHA